jgi:hypothetical protein
LGDDPVFTFAPTVTAVGFNIGTLSAGLQDPTALTVAVFNGATLLDSAIFTPNGIGTFDSFIGIVGLGAFDRVTVTVDQDAAGFDNFRFGATALAEPMALTFFGFGLVLAGLARGRASTIRKE